MSNSNYMTILVLPSVEFDDGSLKKWRENNTVSHIFSTIKDAEEYVLQSESGSEDTLFPDISSNKSIEIWCDENPKVGDLRSIISSYDENILMVIRSPHRAKFDKDKNVIYKDLSSSDKLINLVFRKTGLSDKAVRWCIENTKTPLSALSIAKQLSLTDKPGKYTNFTVSIDKEDNFPWDLFNAVCNGDVHTSSQEAMKLIISGEDPVALCFQTEGYMQKVIMSLSNDAENSKWFSSPKVTNMFKMKAKRVINAAGMGHDLAYYPDVILNSKGKFQKTVFVSMITSLATRFD